MSAADIAQVKPTCVSLMGIASINPTSTSSHASLIDTLTRNITTLPSSALTPSMINYILFPITQILRQSDPSALPDKFLEAVFRLLSHVVSAWRKCDIGMESQAWEQLWRFTASAVGSKMGGKDKGKGREIGQEVKLEATRLLSALLEPSIYPNETEQPTLAMLLLCSSARSPLMPTLFQTITLLLETSSPTPPYHQLQLASLRLLRPLVTVYLKNRHEVLAAVLPGTVSTIAKLVHNEAKSLKGEVALEAAGLLRDVITATLNDVDLRSLGVLKLVLDDLGQLAEAWERTEPPLPPEEPPPSSPAPSTASPVSANPFPPLTEPYLAFTSSQLLASIPPILSSFASHTSHLARLASAGLSDSLIISCHVSLSLLLPHCLTNLLLLSRDSFDPVRADAQLKLRILLSNLDLDLTPTLIELLSYSINALPRLITSQQDQKVDELARLITAIADTNVDHRHNPIAELLGPDGRVERWSWAFLDCLEFGRPTGWSATANTAAKAAERGWQQRLGAGSLAMLIEDGDTPNEPSFLYLPLRYVESEVAARALGDMLVALGSAGGEVALYSVEHFMLFAKANRKGHISKAVSAVWVGHKLLDGIATVQAGKVEAKTGKITKKMAREVAKILVSMDGDGDDEEDEDLPRPDESLDALIPVERSSGLNSLTTILDRKPLPDSRTAAQTRRLHVQAQRSLLTALSLQTLALTSRILSASFRPLLLTSLYTILSHLTSPQPIIAQVAEIALVQVAYHTGYASPQNLVLDNVDYVINVVSLRLTYARLSSTAPLVLIAMIRLVGHPIVPLVHDVVDEIFDALDDYHGYETLASSLLAVLVTLIEVMFGEVEATGPTEERLRKKAEFDRIDKAPDPENDFARFLGWYEERETNRKKEVNEILERAPQHAWGHDRAADEGKEHEGSAEAPMEEDEKPPTRTQEVCTQILEKSIYFLSHRSPFLRARILSLIAHAIPVLASGNREGDLLPIIDRGWGLILNRLDDPEPYVVTEAAEVIASLCENVGDFMSRRVLDHAWPRFQKLLHAQKELDKKSALARRGGVGTTSSFTVSHRLHVAIFRTATFVAKEVPVNEDVLWQIMVIFRPFLDRRAHDELQTRAISLYQALARRDGDALWVVLHATLGTLEGDKGVWDHLQETALDIEVNANRLLA